MFAGPGRRDPDCGVSRQGGAGLGQAAIWIALVTVARVGFLFANPANLDFEEAQYWFWAQSPAWGYFSKPPLIGWLIAAVTAVCGDREVCVRLASPLLHGATALLVGLLARALGGKRLAFWSALTYATLPGISFSAWLMTTDVPLLFFWAVALLAFQRLTKDGGWAWACVTGLAIGFGLLSKYAMAYFLPCAWLYLLLQPQARRTTRGGPIAVALLIAALMLAPNLVWNLAHGWATVRHTAANAGLAGPLLHPGNLLEFVGSQLAVFGPALFVMLWASVRFWGDRSGVTVLLGCFTFPVLGLIIAESLLSRAHANWAAVAYVAGSVLATDTLLRWGRTRLLRLSLAGHLAAGVLLYVGVYAAAAGLVPEGLRVRVADRLAGWDVLGQVVSVHLGPNGTLLSDRRDLLALLAYYARMPAARIAKWNPDGDDDDQFELMRPLAAGEPGPFVLVTDEAEPAAITRRFGTVRLVDTVAVLLPSGQVRTHRLYELRDFEGY